MPTEHRHTLSILVENKFGVLARIAGLFSGRGFNIDTLNVAPTQDGKTSRMTVVVKGDDQVLEQVTKQLNKLVNVIEVEDFRAGQFVDRELVLVRIQADRKNRAEALQVVDIFRAKIVDVSRESLLIEATGSYRKLDAFLELIKPFGIQELTRTGRVALRRRRTDEE
ncbi:MAG: acetolactate synthase small subunit [Verrucomicrobiae bacterium]|nr:acetolactate synthase small subunit [Verrucomicrobiae bacterium]